MKLLYFTRDYTTHDYRFLSKLAQTEHHIYYLRLERRGAQLGEDRALPPKIEIVPWSGGQARPHCATARGCCVSCAASCAACSGYPCRAGAAFGAPGGAGRRPPAGEHVVGLRSAPGRREERRMALGHTLHASAQRCFRRRLRNDPQAGGPVRDARRAHRDLPWGVDLAHFTPGERPQPASAAGAPFTLLSPAAGSRFTASKRLRRPSSGSPGSARRPGW